MAWDLINEPVSSASCLHRCKHLQSVSSAIGVSLQIQPLDKACCFGTGPDLACQGLCVCQVGIN